MYTPEQETSLNCKQCGQPMLQFSDGTSQCIYSSCKNLLHQTLFDWLELRHILDEWNKKLISKLINERQVQSVADVYKLRVKDFIFADLVEQEKARIIFETLSNTKDYPMREVFFSLKIPFIGRREAGFLINKLSCIHNISEASLEELKNLEGSQWNHDRALSIYSWFRVPQNRDLIQQLRVVGLPIGGSEVEPDNSSSSDDEELKRELQTAIEKIESLNFKFEALSSKFIEHFQLLRKWVQKNIEPNSEDIEENSEEAKNRDDQTELMSKLNDFSKLQDIYDGLNIKITESHNQIKESIENLERILELSSIPIGLKSVPEELSKLQNTYDNLDSKIAENLRQTKQWIEGLEKTVKTINGQEDWRHELESLKSFLGKRLVSSKIIAKEASEEIQKEELFSSLQSMIDKFSEIGLEPIQQKLQEIELRIKKLPTQDSIVMLLNSRYSELIRKLEDIETSNASLSKLSTLDTILDLQEKSDSRDSEFSTGLSQIKESTSLITSNISKIESQLEKATAREQQSATEVQNISQALSSQNSIIVTELLQIKQAIFSSNHNTIQLQQQLESTLEENRKIHSELYQISNQYSSLQSTLSERENLLEEANLQIKALQELSPFEIEKSLSQLSQASENGLVIDQTLLVTLTSQLLNTQAAIQQIQPAYIPLIEGLRQENNDIQSQLSVNKKLISQVLEERDDLQNILQEVQVQLQQYQQQNLFISQEKSNIQSELERARYVQQETQQRLEQVESLNSDLQVQKNQIQQRLSSVEEQFQQTSQQLMHSQDAYDCLSQEKQNLQDELSESRANAQKEIEELKVQNRELQQQLKDQETNWLGWLNQRIQQDQDAMKKLIRYILSVRK